jgi:hypothetical protein
MFGIIRPCAHSLSDRLRKEWLGHLCGMCLALRDEHGQAARIATNYDGVLISALVEAQISSAPQRRKAGPCPLRGMRTATIVRGEAARLAATVSLLLAASKLDDHVADRDGLFARRPVAAGARAVARSWATRAGHSSHELGLDAGLLLDAVAGQKHVEATAVTLLDATTPAEIATAAAFAHTAVLAGRPENAEPLAEAGRMFGRIAHLLDAMEDLETDRRAGKWNPLTATGTSVATARGLAQSAHQILKQSLNSVSFADSRLVHALLVHELEHTLAHNSVLWPEVQDPPKTHGPLTGLCLATWMCCTCQVCCRESLPGPWSGKKFGGACRGGCDCNSDCRGCDECCCCACVCCDVS